MPGRILLGDCVTIPDGRIGRVRGRVGAKVKVRVRRATSKTHQFILFNPSQLTKVQCPKGWMSPKGYLRYLKITLAKQRKRERKRRR